MNDPRQSAPKKILILKPSSLGDVVTAIPVLRGIGRTFPQAQVSWLVSASCAELIAHDSDVDEVILFERKLLGQAPHRPHAARALVHLLKTLRRARFDWVIDLQGLLRSGLLTACTRAPLRCGFADAREGAPLFYNQRVKVSAPHTIDRNIELAHSLGIQCSQKDLVLQVAPAGKSFAEDFLARSHLRQKEFLICVPATRWPTKVYPVRHWRTVMTALARQAPIVLLGGPGDHSLCQTLAAGMEDRVINLAGQTSVSQMVGMIAASRGVVCGDSAANFIAPALGVGVVTLLGPTQVQRTGPYLPASNIPAKPIVAPVACQGCLKRRCRHIICMDSIDPQEVIRTARELFL